MADSNGFDLLLTRYGEPQGSTRILPQEAERYRDRVPRSLIDFWIAHGRGGYLHGWVWLPDPAPFDPLLARIFEGDPEYHAADMTTILRFAYAVIVTWSKALNNILVVDFNHDTVVPSRHDGGWIDKETGRRHSNDHVLSHFIRMKCDNPMDDFDEEGRELTEQSISRFGPVSQDQMYGFVPALQMGGPARIENVQKVDMITHLEFLTQVADFHLQQIYLPSALTPT